MTIYIVRQWRWTSAYEDYCLKNQIPDRDFVLVNQIPVRAFLTPEAAQQFVAQEDARERALWRERDAPLPDDTQVCDQALYDVIAVELEESL